MEKTRRTKQRQLILDVLQAEAPLTATQLYERAAGRCPTLAKSTVYRNVENMVQRGELCRGFLENGESFFSPAGQRHRHYMICRGCSKMQDLPACPMEDWEPMEADSGFVATDHVVQVYGYCASCAQKRRSHGSGGRMW